MDEFWISLLIKVIATAGVVVAATYVAERSGPFWGSLFATFPVSAGPAYVMVSMQAEPDFVAASALNSFASMSAGAPFIVALVWLAPRTNAFATLCGALVVWAVLAVPIGMIDWTFVSAAAMNAVVLAASLTLTRKASLALTRKRVPVDIPVPVVARPWFDLPLRALVVGMFVAALVMTSDAMGPVGTGFGATFPISFVCVAVILHRRLGGKLTAVTMASALRVAIGMYVAVPVLYFGVLAWGEVWGLSLALATIIIWAAGLIMHRRRVAARRSY